MVENRGLLMLVILKFLLIIFLTIWGIVSNLPVLFIRLFSWKSKSSHIFSSLAVTFSLSYCHPPSLFFPSVAFALSLPIFLPLPSLPLTSVFSPSCHHLTHESASDSRLNLIDAWSNFENYSIMLYIYFLLEISIILQFYFLW